MEMLLAILEPLLAGVLAGFGIWYFVNRKLENRIDQLEDHLNWAMSQVVRQESDLKDAHTLIKDARKKIQVAHGRVPPFTYPNEKPKDVNQDVPYPIPFNSDK